MALKRNVIFVLVASVYLLSFDPTASIFVNAQKRRRSKEETHMTNNQELEDVKQMEDKAEAAANIQGETEEDKYARERVIEEEQRKERMAQAKAEFERLERERRAQENQ